MAIEAWFLPKGICLFLLLCQPSSKAPVESLQMTQWAQSLSSSCFESLFIPLFGDFCCRCLIDCVLCTWFAKALWTLGALPTILVPLCVYNWVLQLYAYHYLYKSNFNWQTNRISIHFCNLSANLREKLSLAQLPAVQGNRWPLSHGKAKHWKQLGKENCRKIPLSVCSIVSFGSDPQRRTPPGKNTLEKLLLNGILILIWFTDRRKLFSGGRNHEIIRCPKAGKSALVPVALSLFRQIYTNNCLDSACKWCSWLG